MKLNAAELEALALPQSSVYMRAKPSQHQEAVDAIKRARLLVQALPGHSPEAPKAMVHLEDAEVALSMWFYMPEIADEDSTD